MIKAIRSALAAYIVILTAFVAVLSPAQVFAEETDVSASEEETLIVEEASATEVSSEETLLVEEEAPSTYAANSYDLTTGTLVVSSVETLTFNAKEQTPKVVVSFNGKTLTQGRDFTAIYESKFGNTSKQRETVREGGRYSLVFIVGKGSYTGKVNVVNQKMSAFVQPVSWSQITVESGLGLKENRSNYKFEPATLVVKLGDETLIEGTDYSFTVKKYVDGPGQKCTVILHTTKGSTYDERFWSTSIWDDSKSKEIRSSKGEFMWYENNVEYQVKCFADINDASVTILDSQGRVIPDSKYTGQEITPLPGLKWIRYDAIIVNRDFTATYENNVEPGTATVTLTGIGNYYGERSFTFEILAPQKPQGNRWRRMEGGTALDTMYKVAWQAFIRSDFRSQSNSVYASDEKLVFVATEANFKDALSVSALAGAYGAPIVLTKPNSLPQQTADFINNYPADHVVIVGGPNAITDVVESQIVDLISTMHGGMPSLRVSRVYGRNAADTSREVAKAIPSEYRSKTVIIATSKDYPDALAISPYAYAFGAPIILTEANNTLGTQSLKLIKEFGFTEAIIVGLEGAVPKSVETALKNAGLSVTRLGGGNAILTSKAIAEWELSHGFTMKNVGVATRGSYKDALVAAPFMGLLKSPIILTTTTNYAAIDGIVATNHDKLTQGWVFGGPKAVSEDTFNYLKTY